GRNFEGAPVAELTSDVPLAKSVTAFGNARPAETIPAVRRKPRRFMTEPRMRFESLFEFLAGDKLHLSNRQAQTRCKRKDDEQAIRTGRELESDRYFDCGWAADSSCAI